MALFNIYEDIDEQDIRDRLGWAESIDPDELVKALMVLCSTVSRLRYEVKTLKEKKNED